MFEVIGTFLGFIGSIIFSAGLVKTKRQIRDENKTYHGGNPFTLAAEMSARPYYMVGLGLVIAGFPFVLIDQLNEMFAFLDIGTQTFITLLLVTAGYLVAYLFYARQYRHHIKEDVKRLRGIYRDTVRSTITQIESCIGNPNARQLFVMQKDGLETSLRKLSNRLSSHGNNEEEEFLHSIRAVTNKREYLVLCREFTAN